MDINQAYNYIFIKSGQANLSRDEHNQLLIALDIIKKALDQPKV